MLQTRAKQNAPTTVVVIGPTSTIVGGMASVAAQTVALDFGNRYRIESLPMTLSANECERRARRVLRHLSQLRLLQATIRRTGGRIVHIHTCSGFSFYRSVLDMLVAQWLGCRVLLHIHGAAFDEFFARAGRAGRRTIAWSLARADRVVALSGGWARKLQHMARAARVRVIENAVAIPAATPLRQAGSRCRFLLLARMDEWKGIDDLLAACAMLRGWGVVFELVLAGPPGTAGDDTTLGREIRQRSLEGVVRYVGPVRGKEKAELLCQTDVYVQPSHHEGMPISLLEALAYGLPVLATNVGAVPEVIHDRRQGILVPPRDPRRLAEGMRSLALDRSLRAALSAEARALAVQRFCMTRFRDDLVSLYDAVQGSPAGGGWSDNSQTGDYPRRQSVGTETGRSGVP
jgi:glycosyltransferase involved in cell wall biosynthesis